MAYAAHVTYSDRKRSPRLLLFLLIRSIDSLVVYTTVGDVAVLPCEVDPTIITHDELDVEWTRADIRQYVYFQRNGREHDDGKNPSYKGRTSLFKDEVKKGNVSLKLSRVKSSDAGNYTCDVPEFNKKVTVQLIVGEPSGVPDTDDWNGFSDTGTTEGSIRKFPWWAGLLIALSIFAIFSILGVLAYKKKKQRDVEFAHRFGLPNPADNRERSECTTLKV